MRQHIIPAGIAAIMAASVSGGALYFAPKHVEQVTHSIAVSKHAWPDLTDPEKAALAAVLKTLPHGTKFDIICNDAGCADLAADIDDACEAAGIESVLDRSLGPLGYGIAIQVNEKDKAAAEAAAAALKAQTNGALDPPVVVAPPGRVPEGFVAVVIGKYRAL